MDTIINCIQRGDLEDFKELMKGRKVNITLEGGWTPLLYACQNGADSIVKFLLESGASANKGYELLTPLMALCNADCIDEEKLVNCAKLLIQHSAEVDATDKFKSTALIYASSKGHEKLVAFLLNSKCDVNNCDNDGNTSLHMACLYNFPNIVELLLDHGAFKHKRDRRGRTPLVLATSKGAVDIIHMLDEPQPEKHEDEHVAYERQKSSFEELLTQLPCYNDASGKDGFHRNVEELLSGYNLSHKADSFLEKKINLSQFLNIKNDELRELGINFSSHREKLISGNKKFILHPWGKGSLNEVNSKSSINLTDIVRTLANSVRQIHIMWATSLYCNERVILPSESEDPTLDQLHGLVFRARRQTKAMIKELSSILEQVEHVDTKDPVLPADLILPLKDASCVSFRKVFLVSGFCAFVLWKTSLVSMFRK